MKSIRTSLHLALRSGAGFAYLPLAMGVTFWYFAWDLIQAGNAEHSVGYLAICAVSVVTGALMGYAAGRRARRIEAEERRSLPGLPAPKQTARIRLTSRT